MMGRQRRHEAKMSGKTTATEPMSGAGPPSCRPGSVQLNL